MREIEREVRKKERYAQTLALCVCVREREGNNETKKKHGGLQSPNMDCERNNNYINKVS